MEFQLRICVDPGNAVRDPRLLVSVSKKKRTQFHRRPTVSVEDAPFDVENRLFGRHANFERRAHHGRYRQLDLVLPASLHRRSAAAAVQLTLGPPCLANTAASSSLQTDISSCCPIDVLPQHRPCRSCSCWCCHSSAIVVILHCLQVFDFTIFTNLFSDF